MILTRDQYKTIEGRLFSEMDMRETVRDYYAQARATAAVARNGTRGIGKHSDPVAQEVIQTTCPPRRIHDMELWMEVFEMVRERLPVDRHGRLMQLYYKEQVGSAKAMRLLHIEKRTFYYMRDEIIYLAAILASAKRVFTI